MTTISPGTKDFWNQRTAAFTIAVLVLIGIAIMLAHLYGASSPAQAKEYPICAEWDGKTTRVEHSGVQVKIREQCWSAWLQLPPHQNFRVDTPGEVEAWFWNGKHLFFADKNPQWLGDVTTSTFRLRGKDGQATIYLTPR